MKKIQKKKIKSNTQEKVEMKDRKSREKKKSTDKGKKEE